MPDHAISGRPRRTRTGCLKCRSRRRKCDERKPKCQNCIDRSWDCEYGPRLSFLDKNVFTVPDFGIPARYSNVQFVGNGSSSQIRTPPESSAGNSSPATPLGPHGESHAVNVELSSHVFSMHKAQQQIPEPQRVVSTSSSGFQSLQVDPLENDGDVLHALLALANRSPSLSQTHSGTQNHPEVATTQSISYSNYQSLQVSATSVNEHLQVVQQDSGDISQWNPHALPPELELKLLRHFRYDIAPWLDLADLSQQFGIVSTRVSLQSDRVLLALQALSAVSMLVESAIEDASTSQLSQLVSFAVRNERDRAVGNEQDYLLASIFDRTRHFISDVRNGWLNLPIHPGFSFAAVSSQSSPNALHSALWSLATRLDLSMSLLKEAPILIDTAPTIHRPDMSSSSPIATQVFCCAQESMRLCIEAVNFCWNEDRDHVVGVDDWKSIVADLSAWYSSRPVEFQMMIEWDDSHSTFPLCFFTTGGGLFANQLYHTAMLLLLQNKPKTIQLPYSRPSLASHVWHAQHICGIALNNDRRECWDFCLLSSLYVAAKTMTHQAQQVEILRGLDRIQSLTNWSVSYFTTNLRRHWRLPDAD